MLLYGVIICFMVFIFLYEIKRRTQIMGNIIVEANGKFEKTVAFSFFCIIWFLTAFRGINIGNDTITYIKYFKVIDLYGTNANYSIEMGFQRLIQFIGRFTDNPHTFLIVISTLLYLLLGLVILKYSEDYLISVFLSFFLCFGSFCNMMRQSLAMMICLIAYTRLKEGKRIQFIICVIVASFFHISALSVLLLLLSPIFPKNLKVLIAICLVAIALSGTSFLLSISHFLGDEYTGYFNSKYANSGQLGTFLSLIKCVLMYLIIRNTKETNGRISDSEFKIMYTNSALMLIILCCGFTVNLISRISDYFVLISIIDLPIAIKVGGKKNKTLFLLLFFYMILHFLAIQFFRPEWNHLYPYEFWQN